MSTQPFSTQKKSAITIGSFDGVHLGHQQLFKSLVEYARKNELQTAVITFWPLPPIFFKRVPERYALTFPEERAELIKKCGIDRIITLDFNQALAGLAPEEFLKVIKSHTSFVRLFAGADFALGKDRSGDLKALQSLSEKMDFEVEVIDPKKEGTAVISSSQIRLDLSNGKIREATRKLGRRYFLPGRVVRGESRGTKIGFPTANLEIAPERLIPGNGVYVTRAWMTESDAMAVTNIGVRPTFENPLPLPRVEPHLLDTSSDLYESEITLEFYDFIRPEKKFANAGKLIGQIKKDIKYARKVFSHEE